MTTAIRGTGVYTLAALFGIVMMSDGCDRFAKASVDMPAVIHADFLGAPVWILGPLLATFGGVDSLGGHDAQSAIRLSSGTVAVSYVGTEGIALYAPNGRLVRRIGGLGSGPGEFQLLGVMRRVTSTSVGASDLILGRLTIIDESGQVETIVPDHPKGVLSLGDCPLIGFLDGGPVFSRPPAEIVPTAPIGSIRDTSQLLIYDPGGHRPRFVGKFPGTESMVVEWNLSRAPTKFKRLPRPFGVSTDFAISGDLIVVADNGTSGVDLYDREGELVHQIRWAAHRHALGAAEIKAYQEDILSGYDDSARRQAVAAELQAYPYPSELPVVTAASLFVDALGRIWLREQRLGADSLARWLIVDTTGRALGTVRVPSAFTITDAGPDYVAGVSRAGDDNGGAQVYGLRVRKQ